MLLRAVHASAGPGQTDSATQKGHPLDTSGCPFGRGTDGRQSSPIRLDARASHDVSDDSYMVEVRRIELRSKASPWQVSTGLVPS